MSDAFFNPPILDELLAQQQQPVSFYDLATQQAAPVAPVAGSTALYQNLPSILRTLEKKKSLYPQLASTDPAVIRSLQELDVQRALRGQAPLSMPRMEKGQLIPGETLQVLQAMPTVENPYGQSMQPQQEKTALTDIPGNALADIATIFRSIPKIPALAVQTVKDLPKAPEMLSEALGQGDFQKVSQVPGINLIPGAYTLGNVLEGDFGEIVQHPVMTALDVLPAAQAKVFAAPASMLDEAGNLVRSAGIVENVLPKSYKLSVDNQIKAVTDTSQQVSAIELAKNKVMTAGDGRVGDILRDQALALRGSNTGQRVATAFGRPQRELMERIAAANRMVRDLENADSAVWSNPAELQKIVGTRFNMDEPWIRKYTDFTKEFDNEFALKHYDSVEDWGRRRTELGEMVQSSPNEIAQLPAHERAYVSGYREVANEISRPYTSRNLSDEVKELIEVPVTTKNRVTGEVFETKEIYNYKQGARILKARNRVTYGNEFASIQDMVRNPANYTPEQVQAAIAASPVLNTPGMSRRALRATTEGYAHALNLTGMDARAVIDQIVATRASGMPPSTITALREVGDTLPYSPLSIEDLRTAAWPTGPSGRRIPRSQWKASRDFLNMIDGVEPGVAGPGKYGRIKTEFNRLMDAAERDARFVTGPDSLPDSFLALNRDQVNASLDLMRRRDSWLNLKEVKAHQEKFSVSESGLKKLQNDAMKLEQKSVPTRFLPLVGKAIDERVAGIADEVTRMSRINPEEALTIVNRVKNGDVAALTGIVDNAEIDIGGKLRRIKSVDDLMERVRAEQLRSWQDLHAQGLDPIYVHHVPQGKAGFLHTRGVNLSAKKPSWFNERGVDFSPHEGDLSLALRAQAFETLMKKGEDFLNETLITGNQQLGWLPVVRSKAELIDAMRPSIERRAAQTGMKFDEVANQMIGDTYTKWDAKSYMNDKTMMASSGARGAPGVPVTKFNFDDMYIPKTMYSALEKMQNAPRAVAVWDPVMNVFRTTTLLLSPRWQIYNVLGNALTVTMAEGLGWVKHLPEAYKAAQAIGRGEAPKLGKFGAMPETLRLSLGQDAREAVELYQMGNRGKELAGTAESIAGGTGKQAVEWGKKAKSGVDYVSDLSIRLNAMIDDTTRIAGYMSAYDRFANVAPDVAQAAQAKLLEMGYDKVNWTDTLRIQAEQEMRKFAYNWDEMTPFERTVARRIFPFYGFFSHMMRYAWQYTMDHPLRVAVTAAFARNELQDWGTGMPSYLHNLLFVGAMDEEGNRKAVNFKGWNPFADLSTLLTPVGWLSQANPIISTLAEQFGIDPRTGEASLYPTAAYNEQTGRLELKKRNVFQSFIENTIPQTQVITSLSGSDPEFNRLARSQPEAASRLIASALGLPVLVRDVNVPQEIAKAELARKNAAASATNEAIRTGSIGPVRAYPALRAQVEQLQSQVAANPQTYAQYQMPVGQPGFFDLASGAGKAFIGAG